ncbi:MAG: PilZ domain-containing protein [Gemmatimonadaceae bacterium]
MAEFARPARVNRILDVTIQDRDGYPMLVRLSKTVNLSQSGLLMHVPLHLDAAPGEDIVVRIMFAGGTFESPGQIVRLESPYLGDPMLRVMGIHLGRPLPDALLSPNTLGADGVVDTGHAA